MRISLEDRGQADTERPADQANIRRRAYQAQGRQSVYLYTFRLPCVYI